MITIYDERIDAPATAIEGDELIVGANPSRRLEMDEVTSVYLGNAAVPAAAWIGQDNRDVAQVGGAPAKANGIQDAHIRLTGLRSGQAIKQLNLIFQHPKRRGLWRLDPSKSPAWRLVMERPQEGQTADLYFEPNEFDSFEQTYAVNVVYADGQTAKAELKATSHTDHQLKTGAQPTKTDEAAPVTPQAIVYGRDGSQIRGELLALAEERISLHTGWSDELTIPLVDVRAIRFSGVNAADAQAKFDARLAAPTAEDAAIVLGREQGVSLIAGTAHDIADGKLSFTYEGERRAINQPRVAGLVFAAQPKRGAASPYQVLHLVSGDRLSGAWSNIAEKTLALKVSWGAELTLPREAVEKIEFRNGKVAYLSDLEPVAVEEVPYFGRAFAYRRDQSLDGGPLKLKGKPYPKGLAVHSRSVLVYNLDGQYASLKALVGFDETAAGRGRVGVYVLGDGRELLAEPDLRSSGEPLAVDVSITGVKEVSLVVDFGEEEDIGDRVIWADARVFRADKKK
ncbi:MAG TPA: NPCBM/NEW2 domain-containing protein [Pirellulales bacterium]|nr:NPCBM/NEW2 domain-containing protein [Pirellulales bacterium]